MRKPGTLKGWGVLADWHAACRIAAHTEIAATGFPDGVSSFAACYIALVAYYGKRPRSASMKARGYRGAGRYFPCVGSRSTEGEAR